MLESRLGWLSVVALVALGVAFTPRGAVAVPTISIFGSSGTESDSNNQSFSWSVSNFNTADVTITQDASTIASFGDPGPGFFDFNNFGLGTFRIDINAEDGGPPVSDFLEVNVFDDDPTPPSIVIIDSATDFQWFISDATGLASVSVEVTQDAALIFSNSSDSGSFDFSSYGDGLFLMSIIAVDADQDWPGDGAMGTAQRQVQVGDPPLVIREPAALGLFAFGLLGLGAARRRKWPA
ncbi:MAG: hypothetical protein QF578_24850 [Alphaproteobacteria bacterium]|nr:hypothetical protein [Alphaproteobacteria bacterium]